MQYLIDPLTKDIFNYKGRSSRKAYWMFFLLALVFATVINLILLVLASFISEYLIFLSGIVYIYIFFGLLALQVRRFHDLNYSYWLVFIPFYNIYLSILASFVRGTEGPNNYGEDPTNLPSGTTNPDSPVTPTQSTPVTSSQSTQ